MIKIRNFDAEFCGKVPLHQTNLIQPHGVLLILNKDDLSILQASENAGDVFGEPAASLVGRLLTSLLADDAINGLAARLAGGSSGKLPFRLSVAGVVFLALLQQHEHYYLLEIEREPLNTGNEIPFVTIYQDVKIVMEAIDACTTISDTCVTVAKEIKRLSGFDKVMVYRFDEDWNGDVLAEEMEPGMERYISLKFPASDIPKPARELYKKSPYRLIPTTGYEPVRLYPVINPLTNGFADLSGSNLRSVAGVHLEYLRNMKVDASMSTRILKDGELWGLIACHHRTPKYLSYEMCSVFELLSNFISTKIAAVLNRDSFDLKSTKQALQQKLVETVLSGNKIALEKDLLLELLDAEGVAVVTNQQVETVGDTPARQDIEDLVLWLQANGVEGLYHQPSLPQVYEAAIAYAETGSGLLALPVEMNRGDFVLAFRPEAVRSIDWGGNPNEALQFEDNNRKYHPRASFRIWQQTVHQTALPWPKETLEVAETVRNFLIESRLKRKFIG